MKWQIQTKVKYKNITLAQKQEICNGCGGKGGFVKPPHKIFFKVSCNHHDYSYWVGGAETDRKKADQGLYSAMIKDCKELPWFKWLRYRPWCWIYYLGVRVIGRQFFWYSENKRWPVIYA